MFYVNKNKKKSTKFNFDNNQDGEVIRGDDCGPNPGFRHGKRQEIELLVSYVLLCLEIVVWFWHNEFYGMVIRVKSLRSVSNKKENKFA